MTDLENRLRELLDRRSEDAPVGADLPRGVARRVGRRRTRNIIGVAIVATLVGAGILLPLKAMLPLADRGKIVPADGGYEGLPLDSPLMVAGPGEFYYRDIAMPLTCSDGRAAGTWVIRTWLAANGSGRMIFDPPTNPNLCDVGYGLSSTKGGYGQDGGFDVTYDKGEHPISLVDLSGDPGQLSQQLAARNAPGGASPGPEPLGSPIPGASLRLDDLKFYRVFGDILTDAAGLMPTPDVQVGLYRLAQQLSGSQAVEAVDPTGRAAIAVTFPIDLGPGEEPPTFYFDPRTLQFLASPGFIVRSQGVVRSVEDVPSGSHDLIAPTTSTTRTPGTMPVVDQDHPIIASGTSRLGDWTLRRSRDINWGPGVGLDVVIEGESYGAGHPWAPEPDVVAPQAFVMAHLTGADQEPGGYPVGTLIDGAAGSDVASIEFTSDDDGTTVPGEIAALGDPDGLRLFGLVTEAASGVLTARDASGSVVVRYALEPFANPGNAADPFNLVLAQGTAGETHWRLVGNPANPGFGLDTTSPSGGSSGCCGWERTKGPIRFAVEPLPEIDRTIVYGSVPRGTSTVTVTDDTRAQNTAEIVHCPCGAMPERYDYFWALLPTGAHFAEIDAIVPSPANIGSHEVILEPGETRTFPSGVLHTGTKVLCKGRAGGVRVPESGSVMNATAEVSVDMRADGSAIARCGGGTAPQF